MQYEHTASGPARQFNLSMRPEQLMMVSRGFSCLFWSIPLGLGLLMVLPILQLSRYFQLPTLLIGLLIGYCGLILLRKAGPLTARWPKLLDRALLALFLLLYLAPFIQWWRQMPEEPYFFFNVLALYLASAWAQFIILQLAGEVGGALHDESLELETLLFRWASLAFMLVPVLVLALMALRSSLQFETHFRYEMIRIGHLTPKWFLVPLLLPFILTMAMAWTAKENGFAALSRSAKLPPAEQPDDGEA